MPQDLVNIRSSRFPSLCLGGERDSVMSNEAKSWLIQVSATSLDVDVAKDNDWCAIFRKAAEKGIHLVIEVTKGTRMMVDHHNGELDRNGDSDSVEFKRRSDQVF